MGFEISFLLRAKAEKSTCYLCTDSVFIRLRRAFFKDCTSKKNIFMCIIFRIHVHFFVALGFFFKKLTGTGIVSVTKNDIFHCFTESSVCKTKQWYSLLLIPGMQVSLGPVTLY